MTLVVLASNPTPPRAAIYDALAEEASRQGRRFHVLYCAKTERGLSPPFDATKMRHAHTVLRGFHPSLTGLQAHLNPGVLAELNLLKPDVLVVAGPWSTPTILLAGLNIYSPPPRRFYWLGDGAGISVASSRLMAWVRRQAYRVYAGFIVTNEVTTESAKAQAGITGQLISLPDTTNSSALAKAVLSQLYPPRP